jgi:ribosomal protein S16
LITLRLQRKGRKKRPFYHIVVADNRAPRDGRIIERLGRFDNVSEKKELTYDEERIIHWLKIGAQPSNTVRNILKGEGIMYKMHLMRWGKSEEEIEAALTEWREAKEAKSGDEKVSRKEQQKELLKAEEKEYKKQVEEKAAAAAKELERKKAEEAKAKEEEEKAKEEPKTPAGEIEAALEADKESKEEETEAKADDKAAEAEEAPAEEKEETEAKATEEAEEAEEVKADDSEKEEDSKEEEAKADAAEEDDSEEEKEEEKKAEAKKEETEAKADDSDDEKEEAPAQVSTDMNANEAIDHIKDTPLDELKGFVPEDEDRVTVQRAWESKQSD